MHSIKYLLRASILLVALICVPVIAIANPINDTYTDTGNWWNCGNPDISPSSLLLIDEHGGPSVAWAVSDEDIVLTYSYTTCGGFDALQVDITNTSDHMMWDTVLAFEQNAYDWKGTVLAANTWDGVDSTNDATYFFGDIGALTGTSTRYIQLQSGHASPGITYDSMGLDSTGESSNVSVTHTPEPVSSTLFLVGAATLGFRRFRKKRRNT